MGVYKNSYCFHRLAKGTGPEALEARLRAATRGLARNSPVLRGWRRSGGRLSYYVAIHSWQADSTSERNKPNGTFPRGTAAVRLPLPVTLALGWGLARMTLRALPSRVDRTCTHGHISLRWPRFCFGWRLDARGYLSRPRARGIRRRGAENKSRTVRWTLNARAEAAVSGSVRPCRRNVPLTRSARAGVASSEVVRHSVAPVRPIQTVPAETALAERVSPSWLYATATRWETSCARAWSLSESCGIRRPARAGRARLTRRRRDPLAPRAQEHARRATDVGPTSLLVAPPRATSTQLPEIPTTNGVA